MDSGTYYYNSCFETGHEKEYRFIILFLNSKFCWSTTNGGVQSNVLTNGVNISICLIVFMYYWVL